MNTIGWKRKGKCYRFGNNLEHDGPMMEFQYVIDRVYEPELLVPHLFEQSRPELRSTAKPGDFIVAGKNLGKGKPHVQAYIAMRAMGLSLLCESMPFLTYRAAVGRGLMFINTCENILSLVEDGDELEVDFATGSFANLTRGIQCDFKPLPAAVRNIIELGGTSGVLKKWWNERTARESDAG